MTSGNLSTVLKKCIKNNSDSMSFVFNLTDHFSPTLMEYKYIDKCRQQDGMLWFWFNAKLVWGTSYAAFQMKVIGTLSELAVYKNEIKDGHFSQIRFNKN